MSTEQTRQSPQHDAPYIFQRLERVKEHFYADHLQQYLNAPRRKWYVHTGTGWSPKITLPSGMVDLYTVCATTGWTSNAITIRHPDAKTRADMVDLLWKTAARNVRVDQCQHYSLRARLARVSGRQIDSKLSAARSASAARRQAKSSPIPDPVSRVSDAIPGVAVENRPSTHSAR